MLKVVDTWLWSLRHRARLIRWPYGRGDRRLTVAELSPPAFSPDDLSIGMACLSMASGSAIEVEYAFAAYPDLLGSHMETVLKQRLAFVIPDHVDDVIAVQRRLRPVWALHAFQARFSRRVRAERNAILHLARWTFTRDPDHLAKAVTFFREAAARMGWWTAQRTRLEALNWLGLALMQFAKTARDGAYGREAVRCYEYAATRAPAAYRGQLLVNLAAALSSAYGDGRNVELLDRAIAALEAARQCPGEGEAIADAIDENLLHIQEARKRDYGSATETAVWYRESRDSRLLRETAMVLATAWPDSPGAGTRALRSLQRALTRIPNDSSLRVRFLSALAEGLLYRNAAVGNLVDIDQAEELLIEASQVLPPGSYVRAAFRESLVRCRLRRFAQSGDTRDLDIALDRAQDGSDDDGRSAVKALQTCSVLLARYDARQSDADLEAARTIVDRVLRSSHKDDAEHAAALTQLCACLMRSFARSGSRSTIDEALGAAEQVAASAFGRFHPEGASNLTNILTERYHSFGDVSDLDRAVAVGQAGAHLHATSPSRVGLLINVGVALENRFFAYRSHGDLKAAAAFYVEALSAAPVKTADWIRACTNLGNVVSVATTLGTNLSIPDALRYQRAAIDAVPAGSPERASLLSNLAATLLNHPVAGDQEMASIDEAIAALEESVETLPLTSQIRGAYLGMLGSAYQRRFALSNDPTAFERARTAYRQCANTARSLLLTHVLPQLARWARLEFDQENWDVAAEAYRHTLVLLHSLYRAQPASRAHRGALSVHASGIASEAAYALVRVGNGPEALGVMEEVRAREVRLAWERDHADLRALSATAEHLVGRYQHATYRLDRVEQASTITAKDEPQEDASPLNAAREWQAVVDEIRRVPGFERFQQGEVSPEDILANLQPASAIAFVATARERGFCVMAASDPDASLVVEAWPLDGDWSTLVGGLTLTATLERLGDVVMAPIAHRLTTLGVRQVVLVPCGLFQVMPLLAAPIDATGTRFFERFTASVVPSARTAQGTRRRSSASPRNPRLLAIANPLPNPTPLPFAHLEVEAIAARFPIDARKVLHGHDARKEPFMVALPTATHVHLACHATFNAARPLDSSLSFADGERLALREVLALSSLSEVDTVVLSACETALADQFLQPDEVLAMPTGFLQAGVGTVVATMWPVNDFATALLMQRFYELTIATDGTPCVGPADALSGAQTWLRTATVVDIRAATAKIARFGDPSDPTRQPFTKDELEAVIGRFPTPCPFADPSYWAGFVAWGA